MKLAQLLTNETQVVPDDIMLLRHANHVIANVRQFGITMEEYTFIQPISSIYDFYSPTKPQISIVAVIVDDKVYGVYEVSGIENEGTQYELGSVSYQAYDHAGNVPALDCRKFLYKSVNSISTGLTVTGWNAPIMPVLRNGSNLYGKIEVTTGNDLEFQETVTRIFNKRVILATKDEPEMRRQRLLLAKRTPNRVVLSTTVFARNPDVVAEALFLAMGVCQGCGNQAPFVRRSDGSPYLEVHHRTPLSENGEDTIENAVALCPNCHRKAHYA